MANLELERKKLLSAKTPDKYIELSIKSPLKGTQKSKITKEWLTKTGKTLEDIKKARNQHPFWKEKRNKGSYQRSLKRLEKHDYRSGNEKVVWDESKISKFYDYNKEGLADFELAKKFKTSLPGVNHIRRKFKLAERLLLAQKKKISKQLIITLSTNAELVLRKLILENGGSKTKKKPQKR